MKPLLTDLLTKAALAASALFLLGFSLGVLIGYAIWR